MASNNEREIVQILNSTLGTPRKIKREYAYQCPFCKHHKKKLQIDINTQKWHCWVCDEKGRSIYKLLRKAGAGKTNLHKIAKLLDEYRPIQAVDEEVKVLTLPSEFLSLMYKQKDLEYNSAKKYLEKRGITAEDIIKHNIGYCSEGSYRGRIIIPSYDSDGSINYFIARSFYPNNTMKYKNPPASRDIIVFDNLINWNEPITLVEGVFDAIAIKRNAIPLLGKFLSKKLYSKIIMSGMKEVNIALDADARNDALKISKKLMDNGIIVNIIEFDDKDPSELGFVKMKKIMERKKEMNFQDLIFKKLSL